jgi:uncharacterized damage-inducible protein DinB
MQENELENLKYPIGRFRVDPDFSSRKRTMAIAEIKAAPEALRQSVSRLPEAALDSRYRPGGWTVRQVVHHVADSHINSYVRFRLALTEENPAINGYDEAKWAELADVGETPVEVSLSLLESLHNRWVRLLHSLTEEQFRRTFQHPDMGSVTLDLNLQLYAWHGRHHIAQVLSLLDREGW